MMAIPCGGVLANRKQSEMRRPPSSYLARSALRCIVCAFQFAAMIATDADDSIAIGDLPVFLLYRGNQHDDTIVNLSSELDGEFTLPRIQKLIQERLANM